MTVIEYMQDCARKYGLKYLEYDHLDRRLFRLTKSSTEYIIVSSRPDGTYGFFDRIGDSGSGGFDASIDYVKNSLRIMGVVPEVEQITFF